ncbi:hypothetical protein [Tenacibaculum agarivorans]|uniref:hypothetical protein n=1 Tax=Tenacibaculum agarivorans TaxID=1908389 RepID=UPI00094B7CD1|nr:hypothetical protein [Tenacibaculum agarivorans]
MSNSNDPTDYKIYLVNKGSSVKNFWCFLKQPEGINSPKVYANSSAMLSVIPNYEGINTFTIPLQYIIGAGSHNNAVGLDVKIDSNIVKKVSLQESWAANYSTVPPKQGPLLTINQDTTSATDTIGIKSNTFDRVANENSSWYSSMSFGIESANGYVGVTWAPSPNDSSTITPKFAFYIATGNYTSNALADIETISNESAKIELSNFNNLEATVTLTATGEWLVTPGKPQ